MQQHAEGYLSEDTIVARISGAGGAISVVRFSGSRVPEILRSLAPELGDLPAPRKLERVLLKTAQGNPLDDALIALFRGPKSFTGEDVAEIYLHGGSWITQEVLREAFALGCRQALPGEFSFRAVRNGKMTLEQAQAVHDLITSSNSTAHRLALDRLSGVQTRVFLELAETLRRSLTLSEAGIDFSDQDLDDLALEKLKSPVRDVLARLKTIALSFDRGRRIQEGIGLVLAGLPNAGKSTLFNELLGQERSLISDEAGTTRDVIRELVRLRSSDGKREATFLFHDTAGLRETAGRVEKMGIELSRTAAAQADLVLFLVESGSQEDEVLREWRSLGQPSAKTILVMTKADLSSGFEERGPDVSEIQRYCAALGVTDCVWISAAQHRGVVELVNLLVERAEIWMDRRVDEVVLTRQEQVESVERGMVALERALGSPSHDLFSADLRQTLEHLSFFIGQTSTEDLLGRIFSQFCIGK